MKTHLARLEEEEAGPPAAGADLGFFHLDLLAPGSLPYQPKGMALYNELVRFVQDLYPKYGYKEVMTPQLFRSDPFKMAGHYDKFTTTCTAPRAVTRRRARREGHDRPGHCHLFSTGSGATASCLRWAEFKAYRTSAAEP